MASQTSAPGDAPHRKAILERVRRNPEVSVLIVGGGINGAGTFRDLALQGVDVLLVDKGDFCSGASAASSRMIHGGLRYLEYGEFRLVREAVRERNRLLQNAPHYVRPLPTTIPIRYWFSGTASCLKRFLGLGGYRPSDRGALLVKLGLTFYDILTGLNRRLPRHRFASRRKALRRRPALPADILCTATYYDAWVSHPERLCLELIQDGRDAGLGAAVKNGPLERDIGTVAGAVNYVSVSGAEGGAVRLRDELTGEALHVRPRVVVNATGAWIDFTNQALGLQTRLIGGTKGGHLVVDNPALLEAFDGEMVYFENADGRTAVALPWLGKALIGTTDIRIGDPDQARCEEDEVDYIFEAMARVFPGITIERSQILSRFSGVRPLPWSDAKFTGQISRDHRCDVAEPTSEVPFPVLSLVGGKWTTFRAFSEEVTDAALRRLGRERRVRTENLAIGGGKDYRGTPEQRETLLCCFEDDQMDDPEVQARVETLYNRYGMNCTTIMAFMVFKGDSPLEHHPNYSRQEIDCLVRYEHVAHLDDLVLRRTSMALLGEVTEPLLAELAGITGPILGWDAARQQAELERTRRILEERFGIRVSR